MVGKKQSHETRPSKRNNHHRGEVFIYERLLLLNLHAQAIIEVIRNLSNEVALLTLDFCLERRHGAYVGQARYLQEMLPGNKTGSRLTLLRFGIGSARNEAWDTGFYYVIKHLAGPNAVDLLKRIFWKR